jgi:hypothetical protein
MTETDQRNSTRNQLENAASRSATRVMMIDTPADEHITVISYVNRDDLTRDSGELAARSSTRHYQHMWSLSSTGAVRSLTCYSSIDRHRSRLSAEEQRAAKHIENDRSQETSSGLDVCDLRW